MSTAQNLLPAAEVKRRGVAAIEERIAQGPLHLVKRNRAVAVVLSEQDYARLTAAAAESSAREPSPSVWDWLLKGPTRGARRRRELAAALESERAAWGEG